MPVDIKIGALEDASDALDLELDRSVAGGTPVYFDSPEEAFAYPVAAKILELDSISAVLLQDCKITLCRSNLVSTWQGVVDRVESIIRDHFENEPEPEKRERTDDENRLMLEVQNVLNTELNPMVASHGGFIEVTDVKENDVYIFMSGGCQGCGQAAATLKQGVERVLFERIPAIRQILDATDHAAGTNPYYR